MVLLIVVSEVRGVALCITCKFDSLTDVHISSTWILNVIIFSFNRRLRTQSAGRFGPCIGIRYRNLKGVFRQYRHNSAMNLVQYLPVGCWMESFSVNFRDNLIFTFSSFCWSSLNDSSDSRSKTWAISSCWTSSHFVAMNVSFSCSADAL